MKNYLLLLFVICLMIPLNIYAAKGCCSSHGGVDCSRKQSNGKVICNDGWTGSSCSYSSMDKCSGYNASADNIDNDYDNSGKSVDNYNENSVTVNKISKSSDNSIKQLLINDEIVTISDDMIYRTKTDSINVEVILNSTVASYAISDTNSLIDGDNKITIKVIAENGVSKYYNINVIKESLSNNTNLIMYANGEKVIFNNYNSNLINLGSNDELNLEYKLEDEKAQIELDYNRNIEAGNHTIYFYVIAEDGTKQKYDLNIYKPEDSQGSPVIGLGVLGGIGYGIYRLTKKRKI